MFCLAPASSLAPGLYSFLFGTFSPHQKSPL